MAGRRKGLLQVDRMVGTDICEGVTFALPISQWPALLSSISGSMVIVDTPNCVNDESARR